MTAFPSTFTAPMHVLALSAQVFFSGSAASEQSALSEKNKNLSGSLFSIGLDGASKCH